jgi:ribonuclease Y
MAAGLTGIALGWFLRFIISLGKKGSMELEIKEMLLTAREEAERITSEAEREAQETLKQLRQDAREFEDKVEKTEERLIAKEAYLDRRQLDIDHEADEIREKRDTLEAREAEVETLHETHLAKLEAITQMSREVAKAELLKAVEEDCAEDIIVRTKKLEATGKERLEERARDILATSIQRLATSVAADMFATSVAIPSDDVKGKIIGKEGRNIKTFERLTGVEVLIDDTPGSITLSSFDPVRRHIAATALEALIADGRIQPAKIEELVEKAKKDTNRLIKEKGEQAVFEVGIFNLDPRIVAILGRLHFRTSYGQNVLRHSIEMAHLAGMLAEELGADVKVAKAGALLHDIGKAVDHEIAGSHVEIGRRILQKFGADEAVVKAMQAHHEEYPYETIESIIVQVADAISGGRPGARRDAAEHYLKRLGDLEAIAQRFSGVAKAYALQAGREIRVFVEPEQVSDIEAQRLARDIAVAVEAELKYPGEIKVTVIRENRITEFAR